MSDNRRRSLPPVPPTLDKQLRPLVSAISEIVETGEGVRGDPMDRKITYRDLVDEGIATIRSGFRPGDSGSLDPDTDPPPNLAKPVKPEGFNATGGFNGRISLTWTIPGELYSNHSMTRIYRAETDNLANATEIGREAGAFYTDTVRVETEPETYFYWIRFVSDTGVEGPPSDPASAAPLADTGYIIEQITGEIRESELAQDLESRIDLIDGPPTLNGSVASRIATESQQRSDADSALAQQITTVQSQVGDNASAIQTEQTARANEDSALASNINTVQSQVGDNAAAIQTEQTTRADEDGALARRIDTVQSTVGDNTTAVQVQAESIDGLRGQYTVKIDNNGAVSGFGLASTPSDDTSDDSFSEFYVNADRFAITPQGGNKSEAVAPFIVQGGEVYIDTARIRDGTIQEGQIGAVSFGKITDDFGNPVTTVSGKLKGELIEADNLKVAESAKVIGRIEATEGWFSSSVIVGCNGYGGETVGDISDKADNAKDAADVAKRKTNDWTRPGSTRIDGNKIYTGDAYVDTLEIEGNAVTVPTVTSIFSGLELTKGWKTVISDYLYFSDPSEFGFLYGICTATYNFDGWSGSEEVLELEAPNGVVLKLASSGSGDTGHTVIALSGGYEVNIVGGWTLRARMKKARWQTNNKIIVSSRTLFNTVAKR